MGERTMRQRWAGAIPVLGPLFRLAALSDFCHLLAVFVEVHMPMARAVRLTGQAINDMWLQAACEDLAREIEQGQSSQSSAMAAGLPAAIAQMLRDSSSASTLVEALQGLGDIYAARASTNSRFIAVIVEPFILVFTAASIGTIVVALYLPLINLLNMLSL
jgi:type II secretory pathway component PulF